ncbi:hypothetical protein DKP78_21860, partial [Enterococcus faecium]
QWPTLRWTARPSRNAARGVEVRSQWQLPPRSEAKMSIPVDLPAYFGPSWTLVSVRAGHARRLDFDTVLGRSGQLRFGHLDDAGP